MRGCSKRAGALLKGMEQQLYGSKGEATGLRDERNLPLNPSRRPSVHLSSPSIRRVHPSSHEW
jgi:hypothetical protein